MLEQRSYHRWAIAVPSKEMSGPLTLLGPYCWTRAWRCDHLTDFRGPLGGSYGGSTRVPTFRTRGEALQARRELARPALRDIARVVRVTETITIDPIAAEAAGGE